MGCFSGLIKYILFFFNFVIVICAIALIALGAIDVSNQNKGLNDIFEFSIGGFAIAIGVIIFFIAFFGCCGALKENSCMLTTYSVIMFILFILQVALGILVFISIKNDDGSFNKTIKDAVSKIFDKYVDTNGSINKEVVVDIQKSFDCCGVTDASYWVLHLTIPPEGCNVNNVARGCAEEVKDTILSTLKTLGGIAIGFGVVELVGGIFACVVRNRGKHHY